MEYLTMIPYTILLYTVFKQAIGLKCYSCFQCNDPFQRDKVKIEDFGGSCMKIKARGEDTTEMKKGDVMRGGTPIKGLSECKEQELKGQKVLFCLCHIDLCNGSDLDRCSNAISLVTVVMGTVIGFRLFF